MGDSSVSAAAAAAAAAVLVVKSLHPYIRCITSASAQGEHQGGTQGLGGLGARLNSEQLNGGVNGDVVSSPNMQVRS